MPVSQASDPNPQVATSIVRRHAMGGAERALTYQAQDETKTICRSDLYGRGCILPDGTRGGLPSTIAFSKKIGA